MAAKWLFYNIDSPVGKYCPNQAADVYLIRFLLKRINNAQEINGPYKNLPVISTWDQQLSDAILWFQKTVKNAGKSIATDGRVDPSPTIGSGHYTVTYLNATYMKRYPQYKHRFESDPEFPNALRPAVEHVYV